MMHFLVLKRSKANHSIKSSKSLISFAYTVFIFILLTLLRYVSTDIVQNLGEPFYMFLLALILYFLIYLLWFFTFLIPQLKRFYLKVKEAVCFNMLLRFLLETYL